MERCYLKHELTADDKTRLAAQSDSTKVEGAVTTTWSEDTNYIPIPAHVVGISKVYGLVGNSIRSNLFGIEYRMFLNDLYAFGSLDILNYLKTRDDSKEQKVHTPTPTKVISPSFSGNEAVVEMDHRGWLRMPAELLFLGAK